MNGRLIVLFLSVAFACAASAENDTVLFAAPFTGSPVTGYDIHLPVAEDEKRNFKIPEECEQAAVSFSAGAARWAGRVERRLWDKVGYDCDYANFTAQSLRAAEQHDHVSTENFMDVPLATLAIAKPCVAGANSNGCVALHEKFSFLTVRPDLQKGEPCLIRDGVFRAAIGNHEGKLICVEDKTAAGFRIMSAYCADVNSDNTRDAVLRIQPLRLGGNRQPIILTLGRRGKDAAFEIVQDLPTIRSGFGFGF